MFLHWLSGDGKQAWGFIGSVVERPTYVDFVFVYPSSADNMRLGGCDPLGGVAYVKENGAYTFGLQGGWYGRIWAEDAGDGNMWPCNQPYKRGDWAYVDPGTGGGAAAGASMNGALNALYDVERARKGCSMGRSNDESGYDTNSISGCTDDYLFRDNADPLSSSATHHLDFLATDCPTRTLAYGWSDGGRAAIMMNLFKKYFPLIDMAVGVGGMPMDAWEAYKNPTSGPDVDIKQGVTGYQQWFAMDPTDPASGSTTNPTFADQVKISAYFTSNDAHFTQTNAVHAIYNIAQQIIPCTTNHWKTGGGGTTNVANIINDDNPATNTANGDIGAGTEFECGDGAPGTHRQECGTCNTEVTQPGGCFDHDGDGSGDWVLDPTDPAAVHPTGPYVCDSFWEPAWGEGGGCRQLYDGTLAQVGGTHTGNDDYHPNDNCIRPLTTWANLKSSNITDGSYDLVGFVHKEWHAGCNADHQCNTRISLTLHDSMHQNFQNSSSGTAKAVGSATGHDPAVHHHHGWHIAYDDLHPTTPYRGPNTGSSGGNCRNTAGTTGHDASDAPSHTCGDFKMGSMCVDSALQKLSDPADPTSAKVGRDPDSDCEGYYGRTGFGYESHLNFIMDKRLNDDVVDESISLFVQDMNLATCIKQYSSYPGGKFCNFFWWSKYLVLAPMFKESGRRERRLQLQAKPASLSVPRLTAKEAENIKHRRQLMGQAGNKWMGGVWEDHGRAPSIPCGGQADNGKFTGVDYYCPRALVTGLDPMSNPMCNTPNGKQPCKATGIPACSPGKCGASNKPNNARRRAHYSKDGFSKDGPAYVPPYGHCSAERCDSNALRNCEVTLSTSQYSQGGMAGCMQDFQPGNDLIKSTGQLSKLGIRSEHKMDDNTKLTNFDAIEFSEVYHPTQREAQAVQDSEYIEMQALRDDREEVMDNLYQKQQAQKNNMYSTKGSTKFEDSYGPQHNDMYARKYG